MTKIVIIGLGAAGFGAALAAKKQDRNAEITIIDNKDFDLMHQCGLPFVLEGEIKDFSNLKHSIQAEKMGMELINKGEIIKLETNNKKIIYKKNNENKEIKYDKLIITSGSKPFVPSIKTENKIFTVHTIEGTHELGKNIRKGEKAVVLDLGIIIVTFANSVNAELRS